MNTKSHEADRARASLSTPQTQFVRTANENDHHVLGIQ